MRMQDIPAAMQDPATGTNTLHLKSPRKPTMISTFLPETSFQVLRKKADTASYVDVHNTVDGVVYPLINTSLAAEFQPLVLAALRDRGFRAVIRATFLRLSLAGTPAPHQAHTDSTMGEWSLMLYLNHRQHCRGGTSLLRHIETGMTSDPVTHGELEIWQRDTNVPGAWDVINFCPMLPNRAFVFPAERMHRAEPIGGFGHDATDGRLVLTAFFAEE